MGYYFLQPVLLRGRTQFTAEGLSIGKGWAGCHGFETLVTDILIYVAWYFIAILLKYLGIDGII
jgi:hypothetical protein